MFAILDANGWAIVIAALGVVLVNILTWWSNHVKSTRIEANVQKIEVATNSMKDDLVKVTGESEKAKGVLMGRAERKAEAAGQPITQDVTAMKDITIIKEDVKDIKKEVVP